VHADLDLRQRLRPEWQQVEWTGDVPADTGLAVLGWPSTDADQAARLVRAARESNVPLVVWDSATTGSPACPHAHEAAHVVVPTQQRARDYTQVAAAVHVHSAAVQPRLHNPMRPSGSRVATAHLAGTGADSVLDEIGALLGPAARPNRLHDVVAVRSGATEQTRVRVLELLAEGTAVLTSGPEVAALSPSIALVKDTERAQQELTALTSHPELRRRTAQLGVREALSTHSVSIAIDSVLEGLGLAAPRRARPVTAIVPTMRPGQITHVLELIGRQVHEQVQLVLITHGFAAGPATADLAREAGVSDLRLIEASSDLTLGSLMNLGVDAADGEYVAKMDDDNFYGAHYLSDLLATFDFSGAQVAGKWAHLTYLQSSGATFLRFPNAENTLTRLVQGGTLVLEREVAAELRFEDLPRRVDTTFLEKVAAAGGTVYSADRYNFVSVRSADVAGHTWKISDSELLAKPSAELFFGEPWAHASI
jgi:hypothetical protein